MMDNSIKTLAEILVFSLYGVEVATADMYVDGQAAQAARFRLRQKAAHVMRRRAALEAVQHDEQRALAVQAIDVHEVAVGQLPALAPGGHARAASQQRSPDGLQVPAKQPG